MEIANLIKNGKYTGNVIILSKRESQELLSVYTKFCEQNKRNKYAKRKLKELEDNLECF